MSATDDLQERFRGVLVGTAVGDALGAPFEGLARVDAADWARWERGSALLRWTDDTHMSIGLAESLAAVGGFDGEDLAARFVAHYEAEPNRGYGAAPPQVFAAIRAGARWDEPAAQLFGGRGSFGNGAAMRAAPAGVFSCHDLEQAAAIARAQARITHAHELGQQGAMVQACAAGWLAAAEPPSSQGPLPTLLPTLQAVAPAPELARALEALGALGSSVGPWEVAATIGNGITAVEAVPAALYAAAGVPRDFAEVVAFAVAIGGDTDTIAAMAGALAGAQHGYRAVPRRWLERLEAHDRLVALADELLAAHRRAVGG